MWKQPCVPANILSFNQEHPDPEELNSDYNVSLPGIPTGSWNALPSFHFTFQLLSKDT